MAEPAVTDLVFFSSGLLFGKDWDYNFNNVLSFLTSDYDVTFGTVTTGTLTATEIYGDISHTTGIPSIDLTLIAGENITIGNTLVMRTDGKAYKATNADTTGISRYIGFATQTVIADGVNTVNATKAPYSGFTGLTAGTIYYIGTSGGVTSSIPAQNAFPIGYAQNTTTIITFDRAQENTSFSNLNISGLTASSAVATDGSKNLVSVTNTGMGNNVLATAPTISAAILTGNTQLGTPISGTLSNCTALPASALTGATLPAGITASSLTSLGTITALSAGTINASSTIQASGDIYTAQLTDYSATSTISDWFSFTTKKVYYKKIGKTVFVYYDIRGLSGVTQTTQFTVPFANNSSVQVVFQAWGEGAGGSAYGQIYGTLASGSSTVTFTSFTGWNTYNGSFTKYLTGYFTYETA